MPYLFARHNRDFSDFASGRVFYNAPGHPAFPVRLGSEIIQACHAYRCHHGMDEPFVLYDPVCGGAYLLSVMGFLHWERIRMLVGSDIDGKILKTAEKNLGLLTLDGIGKRILELKNMRRAYGKQSHLDALRSAQLLKNQLIKNLQNHSLETYAFQADVFNTQSLQEHLAGFPVDVVIADIPYGKHSSWYLPTNVIFNPINYLLESILPLLSEGAVVAMATDKSVKVENTNYERIRQFQMGKRQVFLLTSS